MAIDTKAQVVALLAEYEEQEKMKLALWGQYKQAFETLDSLNARQAEIKDQLKRVLHTLDGPPRYSVLKGKTLSVASGKSYSVKVTYKRKADFYLPSEIDDWVYSAHPNIITSVDTVACAELAVDVPSVARAWRKGAYMTPTVTVERLKRDE